MPQLVRISDNVGDSGARSEALGFDNNNKVVVKGNRPMLDCLMLVGSITARSYHNQDWWCTTPVTEIIEEREDYVKFKTRSGSIYEWKK